MQKTFERILTDWNLAQQGESGTYWQCVLRENRATVDHYKAFLRETYHQAGQNPQLQGYATAFFPQEKRDTMKKFYKHAISEIGHDLLALKDLAAMGENVQEIQTSGAPLPETVALTAFPFYQIQFRNPVGYLGYLFHLEFNLTQNKNGVYYMDLLAKQGVPREAMTFLIEHTQVDVGHNQLMQQYVNELVTSENDLNAVLYAVRTACRLHHNMISAAFRSAEVEPESERQCAQS